MRLRLESRGHAELVHSAVRGSLKGLDIDEVVRCSWNRCLTTYALDALQPKKPTTVERGDLTQRKERLGSLLSIARIEMASLARLMQHTQYGIMLTDWDGVIVSYTGDPGFSDTARRSGFREGVVWSEREFGTNGMGTCLVTQRPIVIHRRDHFLVQNTQLTCSAAPIFDMQGKLLATLDISGATSRAQTHTLALVDIAAQNIENRALLEACKKFGVLRFHRCAEFVSTPGEGVLAFDEAGTIRGVNRGALKLLGYRNHEALCGQRIEAVLDTSLEALLHLSWRHGFRPDALAPRYGAQRWFASVQAPAEPMRRASLATAVAVPAIASPSAPGQSVRALPRVDADNADVLGSAECDALRRTLEACRWNISATAVRLHLSRRTIYRKMYRHGIARHDFDGDSRK
ncbi:MAG TPA: GAF domain-containing protein [Steroidobacteraceae bacterium]|jgi:transcriptional regulator of acetoin/glycerol metabolism|nr:GAF domain-containing protein [Steroidobacteraceae bacterium]